MTRSVSSPRRAFVLLELIAALLLVSSVGFAFTWLVHSQFKLCDRLADQTHKQSAMRVVLKELRTDMVESGKMGLVVPDGPESVAGVVWLYELTLKTRTGAVIYRWYEDRPAFNREGTTIETPPPSSFSVVRIDPSGDEKRWPLFELRPTLTLMRNADKKAAILAVSFCSDDSVGSDNRMARVYETSLRLGGRK